MKPKIFSCQKVILQKFLESGMSRDAVEQKTKISRNLFSKLLHSDSPITFTTAQKLVKFFGADAIKQDKHEAVFYTGDLRLKLYPAKMDAGKFLLLAEIDGGKKFCVIADSRHFINQINNLMYEVFSGDYETITATNGIAENGAMVVVNRDGEILTLNKLPQELAKDVASFIADVATAIKDTDAESEIEYQYSKVDAVLAESKAVVGEV